MIIFTKIRYKNFLSTGNIFTEIILNKNKSTLIVGLNGHGKSTILDALTFSLFGKAFRNINKPQLLNTINKKDLVVEIEFIIGNDNYKIVRGIKPSIFEIYKNKKLLNQSSESKDYQEILEKQIIKVNYKSFCQVVVLGSATFQPFMQLSKGQRREVIEDLLDLQIFTSMNNILKSKINDNNSLINEVITNKKLLEQKIELIKEHMTQLEDNNVSLIQEKLFIIETVSKEINDIESKINEINNNIENLKLNVSDEKSLKTKINKLETLKHKIEANKSVIKKDIEFFIKNDDCPTCKQSINLDFKNKSIENKKQEIDKINDGLKKLAEEYDKVNDSIQNIMNINDNINNLKLEEHKLKNKFLSLKKYIQDLYNDIDKIKNNKILINQDKIDLYSSELDKYIIKYNDLNDEKNVLNAASLLLKDNGIKAKIIKQYIPIINNYINKYLTDLDFFVQFELNEEFEETIRSRYRDDFSYSSFSEGEKMKINLAILFTWRSVAKLRNSINTNLLIMDEVFDSSLDSNGTEEFMKLINGLTNDINTFIISHKKDQLLDKFDHVITFQKKKNFSKIVK